MELNEKDGIAPMPETDNGTPEIMDELKDDFQPVETAEENANENAAQEEIKSPSGETFNPNIHVSPDSITPKGNFRKKKGAKNINENVSQIPDENVIIENANVKATAETVTFLFIQFGVFAFGEKFRPSNKNETVGMVTSLERYFEQEGITDIPPGVAVCIAFGGYTLAKMREEECRSNFSKIFSYIKNKISMFVLWLKSKRRK